MDQNFNQDQLGFVKKSDYLTKDDSSHLELQWPGLFRLELKLFWKSHFAKNRGQTDPRYSMKCMKVFFLQDFCSSRVLQQYFNWNFNNRLENHVLLFASLCWPRIVASHLCSSQCFGLLIFSVVKYAGHQAPLGGSSQDVTDTWLITMVIVFVP